MSQVRTRPWTVITSPLLAAFVAIGCMPSAAVETASPRPTDSSLLPSASANVPGALSTTPPSTPLATEPPAQATTEPLPPELPRGRSFLQCDGSPSSLGSGSGEIGVHGGGATPEKALEATLEGGWFVPLQGYRRTAESQTEVLFVYRTTGEVKVTIIASNEHESPEMDARWAIIEIWACESQEFGANVELGEGRTTWVNDEGRILVASRGVAHCDLQSVTFLRYPHEGEQYVRDPDGALDDRLLVMPYDGDAELPEDAVRSGYRKGDQVLWVAADADAVYVAEEGDAERWPRARRTIACD